MKSSTSYASLLHSFGCRLLTGLTGIQHADQFYAVAVSSADDSLSRLAEEETVFILRGD